jgi:hypothetical protein
VRAQGVHPRRGRHRPLTVGARGAAG